MINIIYRDQNLNISRDPDRPDPFAEIRFLSISLTNSL